METLPVRDDDLIRDLRSQSTWRLFGLAVVTYGVYYAHYIVRQTRVLNERLPDDGKISPAFASSILTLAYLTLGLFIGYLFVEEDHPIAVAGNVLDRVWMLLILVWGFYARNRMNTLTSSQRGELTWFSGLWTLLFTPLYFNYKINVLSSSGETGRVVA